MNKAVKKLAALFLALAMMLTLLPGAAFAQGEETAETGGQSSGITLYTLTGPTNSLWPREYDESSPPQWETGSSFQIRFVGVDGEINAGAVTWAGELPAGISIAPGSGNLNDGTPVTFLNVAIDKTAATKDYELAFSVNGASVTFEMSVRPAVYTYFSADDGKTWQPVDPNSMKTGVDYQLLFSNKTDAASIDPSVDALGPIRVSNANVNNNTVNEWEEYFRFSIDEKTNVCTIEFHESESYSIGFEVMNSDRRSSFPGISLNLVSYQLQYKKPGEDIWSDYASDTTNLILTQDVPALEFRLFKNEETPVPFRVQAMGQAGAVTLSWDATNTILTITRNSVTGTVYVPMSFNTDTGHSSGFSVTVQGDAIEPDVPSAYADAVVRQVVAGSYETVTFENVAGEMTEGGDAEFTLSDDTLSFADGKLAGIYKAVVGGKTYAVAVMKPLEHEDDPAVSTVTMRDHYVPTGLPANPGMPNGIYACTGDGSQNVPDMGEGMQAIQAKFIPVDEDGKFDRGSSLFNPIYLYRVAGGSLVSMDGYSATLSSAFVDAQQYFNADFVEVKVNSTTVTVLKLTVKPGVLPASASMGAYVSLHDANEAFVGTVEFMLTQPYDGQARYGFTTQYMNVPGSMNVMSGLSQSFKIGEGPETIDRYLIKRSGSPAQYDFVLYDDVDVSSLAVTSSNNDFVSAESYLAATPDGKNAIGIRLQVLDDSKAQTAEITVSFTAKNAEGEPEAYTFKGTVACVTPAPVAETTVNTVEEFQAAYQSMTYGTIYLDDEQGGVYAMDIYHNKGIAIKAADGANVTITGDPAGSADSPIITIDLSNPAEISGIVIDGAPDGQPGRMGMRAVQGNCYVDNMVIRNCTVGVSAQQIHWVIDVGGNSRFENNDLAIEASTNVLRVRESTFTGNTTAISFTNPGTTGFVQMNRFIDNITDFRVDCDTVAFPATQNYFAREEKADKPVVLINGDANGKVYYSPWFTDEAMTLYTADLEGAVAGSTGYTVPVDRTISSASLLDSALFEEMKGKTAAVSIPVTEAVDDKALVTTVWGFDSGKLAEELPAEMDLEVTDALSAEARAVVDKVVENPEAIAQAVNFSHDGALPGTATVMVRKTGDVEADELKLYYINETTGTVEQAEIVAVSETTLDGVDYYVVTVAHCSEYLIAGAITLKEEGGSEGGNTGNTGSTGSASTPAPTAAPTAQPAATPTPTQAPASANQLVSALEVEERFASAQSGEVSFAVDRKPLVSAGAFGILARNPDKTLVLEGEGYAWRFEGAALTDPGAIEGASFDTTVSLTSPNAHLIAPLVKDVPVVNVYFSYHGALPGPAQVSVQLSEEQANTVKYLYYFNSAAVALEYVGEATVDALGVATFTIQHCSDYVLLDGKLEEADAPAATPVPEATEAPEATQAPAAQESASPAGGSTGFIVAAVAAAAVLAAVILLLVRRRKGE